jgi:hypothetical protein
MISGQRRGLTGLPDAENTAAKPVRRSAHSTPRRGREGEMRVNDVAWAAGLFVGEGNVGRSISRTTSGTFEYIHIQIGMYDERAISQFATAVGVSYRKLFLKARSRFFYRVLVRGRTAERILASMWPYIEGTDKGDQALVYAKRLGVEDWITGYRTDARPQLNRIKRGRKVQHESQCL